MGYLIPFQLATPSGHTLKRNLVNTSISEIVLVASCMMMLWTKGAREYTWLTSTRPGALRLWLCTMRTGASAAVLVGTHMLDLPGMI